MSSFQSILDDYGVHYLGEGEHHHSTQGWLQLDCPYCGKNSEGYHLGYNLEKGFVNCWRCGPHPLAQTVIELTGMTFSECKAKLGEIDTNYLKEPKKVGGKLKLPYGLLPELPETHKTYLKQRGFDPDEIVQLWKVQALGLNAPLRWRLFIPIIHQGETVSWTSRSLLKVSTGAKPGGGHQPGRKYISAKPEDEAVFHKDLLYGEDYVRHAIIIHEGPTDVWATGPGAVCTFGLGVTEAQIARMTRYAIRVVCFDSEKIAQERARRLLANLSSFPGTTFNVQLSGKDAASSPKKEILKLRKYLE